MRDQLLLTRAKQMRSAQTPLEQRLWVALRARRFGQAKFRRQVVIGRYIVDFACRIPRMVVIEVDGDTHGEREAYDARRTAELEQRGYRVLRFTNYDVGVNFEGVLSIIADALGLPLSPALSPEGERGKEERSPEGERGKMRQSSPSGERGKNSSPLQGRGGSGAAAEREGESK